MNDIVSMNKMKIVLNNFQNFILYIYNYVYIFRNN